jgi:glycerol-3-phosphate cytidylyltransferase
MKKKPIIGYTTGVFDLFHIGHLNILRNAKSLCDYLIVGVTTDEVSLLMKGKLPVIPFEERFGIIESVKYVDKVVAKTSTNNIKAWQILKFDIMIKGDDWKGTKKGLELEQELATVGVLVKYLPYTQETSSSILRIAISNIH